MAVVRKPLSETAAQPRRMKSAPLKHDRRYDSCRQWITAPDAIITAEGDRLFATLPSVTPQPLWPRLLLGEIKGKDVIPSQELAMSTLLAKDRFPACDVALETARAYLRREAISIDAPRGFVLLTFDGQPLGWVKNLGNRANNLYPPQWRIRMTL